MIKERTTLPTVYLLDDDTAAISLLKTMLNDYSVDIIGATTDVDKARHDIVEMQPDLLFLDIEMPTTTGLDFWHSIRHEVKPEMKAVFYTGYDKYVLEALRRNAFDYMLKPATKSELAGIMNRFYEQRMKDASNTIAQQQSHSMPNLMVVNAINEHTVLKFSDVAFFQFNSQRKLWQVVTQDGSTFTLRHKTNADVILNYSSCFVQIHKQIIVNIDNILKIQDNTCILQPPMSHIDFLKISKNYRSDFMNTFYNL